jgi:uncharacterized spore protein YtfJ
MEVQDVIAQARDALTVKRVFGEPYEKDGVTIIPAATVQGGAGGGSAATAPISVQNPCPKSTSHTTGVGGL